MTTLRGSGDSSASGSSLPAPMQLHSTSNALSSLVVLAHDSLRDHVSDFADAHRWFDSFFDKLESRATSSNGGPRPALSELMKTPGRKRTVGANATNHAAAGHSLASAKKDPLATLLFADAGSARSHSPHDKENSTFSPTRPGNGTRTSPRKLLSPLAAATASSRTGKPAASPIRLSPRPASAPALKEKAKIKSSAVPEPAPAQEPIVEEASVEPEQPARPVADRPVHEQPEPTTAVLDAVEEEVKADLSIIGEEEEEDAAEGASSSRASEAATSLVTETQLSQPVVANTSAQLPPRSVLSPPRNVSNASSVAPEADAEEDHTVPLNDNPSTLRSVDLSSSLSASTTRTPGSSASRFTLGTYSAGKLGGLGIGSSPPQAGTAPATAAGGRLANPRISSGGPAPRQLNFVGLPKKSLGHGLGLGRGWNNQSASTVGDSQSSTATSNKSVALSDSAPATDVEVEQATTVTAFGSSKRKSLTGPDLANKTPKLAEPALTEQELKRKRYEELNNRMQSLQARQSVLGGRASNVAGPFGANAIFGANKPFGGSSSSLFQSTAPLANTKSTVGAAQSTAVPASAPVSEAHPQATNARRPSVMERVRSFESNTTGTESMHPPSPSKIPAALTANSHHVARPTSPPLSPRRLASPGPASPRLMGRSATSSALPLASFGSPRSAAQSAMASPRLAAMTRSPTAQASVSISSMLESAPKAPVAKLQSPSKSPVRPDVTASATRSSTPVGSPPALNLQVDLAEAKARQQVDVESRAPEAPLAEKVVHEEDEEEEEEEEEEPTMSIRAVNASVDPATVAAVEAKKRAEAEAEAAAAAAAAAAAEAERVRNEREASARRAAEQAARALEEQEAQREREELLKKRLPSLPEPKAPTDDEASSSDEEREVQATKVAQGAPPKGMPGSFAAEDVVDEMEQDEDDFTSMSVMSTATASSTLNLTQHQPFKPVVAHKATGVQKHAAKSSIASSVSTTSTLSRPVSNNALATSISKKPKIEVNAVKRAAAAAKKEKEERERQAALREEKRAALLKRKQEEERKAKVEGLEKKRKEREEAANKATKGSVVRGVKPKTDEEPAKKRKIEADGRSAQLSLAASQGRAGGMGPPPSALNKSTGASSALNKSAGASSALSKSTGATAMIGHSFMSSKINLAGGGATAQQARPPASSASKPLGPSSGNPAPPRVAVEQQQRAPAPAPEPEVYQELPDIDSEYSDSDDEVAQEQKQAALPGWAKSPNLVRALQRQQEINPDDIFGPIPKLSIGEMFRNANSTARLRLRTSSARWEGTDDLTQADIARYHRAMGFRSTSQQPGPSNNQQ